MTFYFKRIPDGESAADVYDRVSDFFGTLHRDFEKIQVSIQCNNNNSWYVNTLVFNEVVSLDGRRV